MTSANISSNALLAESSVHDLDSRELLIDRTEILKMAALGHSISETMLRLCEYAERYSPDMICSVLRLDESTNTLHPLASISLPDFYCSALEGVEIGRGVGSCGTAAFTKERVVVEDIDTHPYWAQYKDLAHKAGLRACWSEPVRGQGGKIFGTFAMYYSTPRQPTAADIDFIEMGANLAAVVFENDFNRQQLLAMNEKLSLTLDERALELEEKNRKLAELIEQQDELHRQRLKSEKLATATKLVVGVAQEVNTPVGVCITANTFAKEMVKEVIDRLLHGEPFRRSELHNKLAKINEALQLNVENMSKVSELISRFKEINVKKTRIAKSHVNLREFFESLRSKTALILNSHQLELDIVDTTFFMNGSALQQVCYHLIENAVQHGFDDDKPGKIVICAMLQNEQLVITFQDNGRGISSDIADRIFEPFIGKGEVTTNLGLGLNIVANIMNHHLNGTILLNKGPTGTRFTLTIPPAE